MEVSTTSLKVIVSIPVAISKVKDNSSGRVESEITCAALVNSDSSSTFIFALSIAAPASISRYVLSTSVPIDVSNLISPMSALSNSITITFERSIDGSRNVPFVKRIEISFSCIDEFSECKTSPDILKVDFRTGSSNVSRSLSILVSRTKSTNSGGIVSSVYFCTSLALDSVILSTSFGSGDKSSTAADVRDKYVVDEFDAKILNSFMLSKSSSERVTVKISESFEETVFIALCREYLSKSSVGIPA